MIEGDEDRPKQGLVVANLEAMSIAALHAYIADLHKEVERAREEIDKKERARRGAAAIFRP